MIRIPGYTFQEKVQIAQNYIILKQLKLHGLVDRNIVIDRNILMHVVTSYTREAGVRGLERRIAAICRSLAMEYATWTEQGNVELFQPRLSLEKIQTILGVSFIFSFIVSLIVNLR